MDVRVTVDAAVSLVHIIAVVLLGTNGTFFETDAGRLLLGMEVVTILFHVFYAVSMAIKAESPFVKTGEANPFKWLEYSISATLGGFAMAYVNGDPNLSTPTQILLAGAGIAQQCSGFQLERHSDIWSAIVAYVSALGLQVGEFAVVYLAISETPTTGTWKAYGTYVVGYSVFGIVMAAYLIRSNNIRFSGGGIDDRESLIDKFEVIYSVSGLVAKLGLLFSEAAVHYDNEAASDGILSTVAIFTALLIILSVR